MPKREENLWRCMDVDGGRWGVVFALLDCALVGTVKKELEVPETGGEPLSDFRSARRKICCPSGDRG